MADKINYRDAVYLRPMAATFDGKGWHGKGIPTTEFTPETLKRILFNHKIVQTFVDNGESPIATGEFIAIAEDDKLPVGNSVGNRFNTPLNVELFELFSAALEGSEYELSAAGTVDNRQEFFLDAKWKNEMKVAGRDVAAFVGLNRGFGGKKSLCLGGHNWIMQCANTVALFCREIANADEDSGLAIKNTQNFQARLETMKVWLEKSYGFHALWAKAMENAASEAISRTQAMEAFAGLITSNGANKLATRSANRVSRLVQLFSSGGGNTGENLADWLSAVTDFYSHESAGSVEGCGSRESFLDKQWFASERGSGAKVKSEVTNTLFKRGEVQIGAFQAWQKRGQAIIIESDKEVISLLN